MADPSTLLDSEILNPHMVLIVIAAMRRTTKRLMEMGNLFSRYQRRLKDDYVIAQKSTLQHEN